MALFQTDNLSVEIQDSGIARCWIDAKNRTYNVFSRQMLADVSAALDRVTSAPDVRALVFLGRKETGFMAGADLHEFTKIQGPADAMALSETGQRLMDQVENLRVPTIAVIHGPCLGGVWNSRWRRLPDRAGRSGHTVSSEIELGASRAEEERLPRVVRFCRLCK